MSPGTPRVVRPSTDGIKANRKAERIRWRERCRNCGRLYAEHGALPPHAPGTPLPWLPRSLPVTPQALPQGTGTRKESDDHDTATQERSAGR